MSTETDLAAKRKALGINQEQLALLLGVTQGTVSRNENAEVADRRFELSLDALAARKDQGEDLAAAAAKLAAEPSQAAA